MSGLAQERLTELLVDRATEGLAAAQEQELFALIEKHSEEDSSRLEQAAAAIELAYTRVEAMPEALLRGLRAQAEAFRAGQETGRATVPATSVQRRSSALELRLLPGGSAAGRQAVPQQTIRKQRAEWSTRLGWLAAAAAFALALLGWLPRWTSGPPRPLPELPIAQLSPKSPEEKLATLAERDPAVLRLAWTRTEDPAAERASGEVVWSDTLQEGYLRFVGLPVNDPRQFQYQLWIFDQNQDERFPIDGGVFDIDSSGQVVVPIDPKLKVSGASLFAVTVEQPGGVVVSSRERLPLLAKV